VSDYCYLILAYSLHICVVIELFRIVKIIIAIVCIFQLLYAKIIARVKCIYSTLPYITCTMSFNPGNYFGIVTAKCITIT